MTNKPDPHWEVFAKREPYFSVLTAPKFLRANFSAEHAREFFESGADLIDWMFYVIEWRLQPQFAPMTMLEYGCGVGRLAIPLAQRPGAVTAVDRSPAMLGVARDEASRRGAGHIDFRTAEAFAVDARTFDLVTCYNVLQRLAPSEGLVLLRQLIGRIGAGGVGVFHVPYRATASIQVSASRWLRARVPPVNGLVNVLRGKPVNEPFIPTHVYDLAEVLRVFEDAQAEWTHVVFEDQRDFAGAIIFVEQPEIKRRAADRSAGVARPLRKPDQAEPPIDVRRLIDETSIDQLNRTAEEYFATLTDWEHHLAKPFSKPDETPLLLMDVAILLQALKLTPGATVLDFGAGTGWLSRFLTQLGCRVILLDVSPTALQMARETYARLPVIGQRPEPQFLLFDGRRIDLPDASVERIVSFHAFHHVPNSHDLLGEFGRILTPGGLAGFIEPGPRHSRAPMSQFEMRTYNVVENDVDIHAIWRTAQTSGFSDLKMMAFFTQPFHVSLEEYEELLTGGPMAARWLTVTRDFMRHVRSFLLFKEGTEREDSRAGSGLKCEIRATLRDAVITEQQYAVVDATVTNTGTRTWLPAGVEPGGVLIGAHLYDAAGTLLKFDFHAAHMTTPPREISPGDTLIVHMGLPPLPRGSYRVEIDCVAADVTWFAQVGSRTAMLNLEVR